MLLDELIYVIKFKTTDCSGDLLVPNVLGSKITQQDLSDQSKESLYTIVTRDISGKPLPINSPKFGTNPTLSPS